MGTVQMTSALPARSYYREQIAQIVPQQLLDRDTELGELAAFCTSPDDDVPNYQWWRAPKWAGKTALMARFALQPPTGVRVVAFFVTARWAGHDTRTAFVDIVSDQLAEILAEPSPTTRPPHVRDSYLTGLLIHAAERCREQGERLVLLVDGLDEDRGTPHDQPGLGTSIAAALPTRPPAGVRIVVSGRPHPQLPGDVPADHPLRDPSVLRPLDVSPHAKVAEEGMRLELHRLLHANPEERDLLGLLTAARGGLTAADLAELTKQAGSQVRRRLRGVAARTFDTRSGHWRRDVEVYLLGHEDLQATAIEELGEHRLEQYQHRLHKWATHYLDKGWPPETPEYLLRGYHHLLAATDDLPRMIALATDPARHNRMLDLSGGDTTALTEIATTQDQILRRNPADLQAMLRLAIHRDHLLTRNSDIPTTLPAHWARRGNVARAEALAHSISDPVARCSATSQVSVVMDSTGNPHQARSLIDRTVAAAHDITGLFKRDQALLHIVTALAAIGDLERAEALARDITDPYEQVGALIYLAGAVTRTGDIERARALIDHAETIARKERESGGWQYVVWMGVDHPLGQTSDLQLAENIARGLGTGQETWALKQLVEAATETPNWERAEATARDTPDPQTQARTLTRLAVTVARSGDVVRGRALIDHAEATIRTITDVGLRAEALADLATTAAQTGDTARARSLIEDVESVVHDMTEPYDRMRTLQSTATAIAECGDLLRAEAVARSITDLRYRTSALGTVALACARTDDLERAEAITHDFADVPEHPHLRTLVAEAIAEAGDLVRAEKVARTMTALHRRKSVLGEVAVALAQTGDVERAEAIARSEFFASWRWPLDKIAVVLARTGNLERAEAIACTLTYNGDRASALGQVAATLAHNGHTRHAHSLLDQAETTASHILDAEQKAQTFIRLAAVATTMNDHARLRSLIDHIASIAQDISADGDGRALTLTWLVERHLQNGDLERADSAARTISDPDMLARLVDAFAKAGEQVRAHALIEHAEGIARGHYHPDQRTRALTLVAKALVQLDDLQRARSLIDDAETIAHNITKPKARDSALHQVANALVWIGDLERAKTVAYSFSTSEHQNIALTFVAKAIAEAGGLEHAKDIARCITDPDQQAEAMLELARSWCPANSEVTGTGHRNLAPAQDGDTNSTDRRWSLIAESLKLTRWEGCLDILTELVPAAPAAAVRELDMLDWHSIHDRTTSRSIDR